MMTPDLAPYEVLLVALLEERLTVQQFVYVYVALFKHDPLMRPSEIYEELNRIFGLADSVPLHDAGASDGDEGSSLMTAAAETLTRLRDLVDAA